MSVVIQTPRQTIKSFTYITHAFCSNCFHDKKPVFWFEKPIARCPNCKHSLRQNTQKKRWKERIREAILINSKTERRKKIMNRAKAKWKRKKYEKNKTQILQDLKDRRRADNLFVKREREITKNWKLKNKKHISDYNRNYRIRKRLEKQSEQRIFKNIEKSEIPCLIIQK